MGAYVHVDVLTPLHLSLPRRLISFPRGLMALGISRWVTPCPGFFSNALSHSNSPLRYKKITTLMQIALEYHLLCFNSAKKIHPILL